MKTIEELLALLPKDKSLGLERSYGSEWTAYWDTQLWNDVDGYKFQARGKTPEEALTNLLREIDKE